MRKPAAQIRRQQLVEQAISFGWVIAYDGGARATGASRSTKYLVVPWASQEAAQRFLDKSAAYQRRGGRVIEVALVEMP